MELHLIGHDYKYAVEQSLLTLFPGNKPEYPEKPGKGDRIIVRCSRGDVWTSMTTTIHKDGKRGAGMARVKTALLTDEPFVTDRHLQRLVRQSFYKAALDWGVIAPEWGALTGVRPTKLMTNIMREGVSDKTAAARFREKYFTSQARADLCVQTAHYSMDAEDALPEKGVCLYVGIPFCPTRCAYCSFVSHSVEKSMKLVAPFFDALMEEIDATAQQVNKLGLVPVSVYMGGGTPTTLSAKQLDQLLTKLETVFDLSHVTENTVEAGRPDTITMDKLHVLKAHGVSRISVNPQTMTDSVLEAIGRKHTASDILDAFRMVREVGGMAINMDLIAGLPTDTPESFRATMDTVMELAPENITVHTLSLKKGARLMDEGGDIPTPASVKEMVDYAHAKLAEGGYVPYYLYRQKNMSGGFENTGWTKPGYENIYNICIMEELCSIIAMGAGGSTKLVRPNGKIERVFAPKYPNEYISNLAKTCSDKSKIGEFYGISAEESQSESAVESDEVSEGM
ncbi:MAG: coproporphyrinogen dehydrogenase HemZ [Oscillospiraceae bacterium]|nr:coproporphyrinogen dehydrogenase HemZ [Oscillospiraceae bacterium]